MSNSTAVTPRITDRVKRILTMAAETARSRHEQAARAEDMLLAMLTEGGGLACAVLHRLGANPVSLAEGLRGALRLHGEPHVPISELIVAAGREAKVLGHSYVGTEHLLIGIARADSTVPGRLLAGHGVTAETAAATTAELLGRELGR